MRKLVLWLMIFGAIAGVMARAVQLDHHFSVGSDHSCAEHSECKEADKCCDENPSGEHHSDSPCEGGHCHHSCNHTAPLALDGAPFTRLPILDYGLADLQAEGTALPDSPLFELDTPPLI